MARGGCGGAVAVVLEPALDGALGVDPVEADADRLQVAALGGAPDRLRMQSEQLGELARLVVPLDHRLVSCLGVNGKLTRIAPERLGLPVSSIARWETDRVEPGFSTLRRVLQACGFDIPPVLVPFERNPEREARVQEVQRLTPEERLTAMMQRLEKR